MTTPKINNRRDVLLLLLYAPGHSDNINLPISGRTRLVKALFIFKEEVLKDFRKGTLLTTPKFYEFFSWSYGPFSSQVYDDLNFFTLRGFINSRSSNEEPLPQSLIEWEHWLAGSSGGDSDNEIVDFEEQDFFLSEKGVKWTKPMYESLSPHQMSILNKFKNKIATIPLRALLRYVYSTYPEYTDKSEIREQVLDS